MEELNSGETRWIFLYGALETIATESVVAEGLQTADEVFHPQPAVMSTGDSTWPFSVVWDDVREGVSGLSAVRVRCERL